MGYDYEDDVYDLNSIEGIRAIPIPHYKKIVGIQAPHNNIEYKLQRKASVHWKAGSRDLAIECLRKSNEIMPHSNFSWRDSDYLRLVQYLRYAKRDQEASEERERLLKMGIGVEPTFGDLCKKNHNYCCESGCGFVSPEATRTIGVLFFRGLEAKDSLRTKYESAIGVGKSPEVESSFERLMSAILADERTIRAIIKLEDEHSECDLMRAAGIDGFPKSFQTFQKHKSNNSEKYQAWKAEFEKRT